MKILILFASLLIFSDQCPPKSQTANNASSTVNPTPTDGKLEYLTGHWVHSSEEQRDEKVLIFRPKDYKEFPPSRFRMEYIFHKSGDCEWYYLSPDDAHRFKTGKWKIDPKNKNVLEITKDDSTELYRIVELTKDKLRLAAMKSDGSDQ